MLSHNVIFKVVFSSHIRALKDLFLISTIFLAVAAYIFSELNLEAIIFLLLFYLIIYLLPVVIVHYNHYNASKGIEYAFNAEGFSQKEVTTIKYVKKEEIKEINFYMTPNRVLKSGFFNFAFERYYYGEIITKIGESFVITGLLSSKLDDILSGFYSDVPIRKERTIFPMVPKTLNK